MKKVSSSLRLKKSGSSPALKSLPSNTLKPSGNVFGNVINWKQAASRRSEDSPSLNEAVAEVMCLIELEQLGVYLSGYSDGTLMATSLETQQVVATVTLTDCVTSFCEVENNTVWVGCGQGLFEVNYSESGINTSLIEAKAHDRFVKSVLFVGYGECWSCTNKGDIIVWNVKRKEKIGSLSLGAGSHCMSLVNMYSKTFVWIGCDDKVAIYDSNTRLLHKILPLPRKGEVTSICPVGIDSVWLSFKNKAFGFLYALDFSD